jgi:hypothetical protein
LCKKRVENVLTGFTKGLTLELGSKSTSVEVKKTFGEGADDKEYNDKGDDCKRSAVVVSVGNRLAD